MPAVHEAEKRKLESQISVVRKKAQRGQTQHRVEFVSLSSIQDERALNTTVRCCLGSQADVPLWLASCMCHTDFCQAEESINKLSSDLKSEKANFINS